MARYVVRFMKHVLGENGHETEIWVVSRIFRTFIMRRLRFQIAAVDRVAAYSCSIWPTMLFRRCAVVALPPG
jgi:hypothetical protein